MEIKFRLNNSKKAKRLKIAVHPGGEVVVTKPWFISETSAKRFIKSKIDWIEKNIEKQKKYKPSKLKTSKEDYLKNKKKAKAFLERRVDYYSKIYGVGPRKIFVRNQKTRWGSCSSRGNLSFNWQIIKLPEHMANYIIVHEICHLRELNHSKKFWDLVALVAPRYKEIRKLIRLEDLS